MAARSGFVILNLAHDTCAGAAGLGPGTRPPPGQASPERWNGDALRL